MCHVPLKKESIFSLLPRSEAESKISVLLPPLIVMPLEQQQTSLPGSTAAVRRVVVRPPPNKPDVDTVAVDGKRVFGCTAVLCPQKSPFGNFTGIPLADNVNNNPSGDSCFCLLESGSSTGSTNGECSKSGVQQRHQAEDEQQQQLQPLSSIDALFQRSEVLGEGTYGVVYKASRLDTGEIVALKKLRWEYQVEGIPATSAREVVILRVLDHPNVVKLKGVHYEQNSATCQAPRIFLEFEYVEKDLRKYMKTFPKRRMPVETVRLAMFQLLSGLEYCHSLGIIHRDIKPNNLLLKVKKKRGRALPPTLTARRRTTTAPSLEDSPAACSSSSCNRDSEASSSKRFDKQQQADVGKTFPSNREDADLQLDNIEVKLADFGLARSVPQPLKPMTHEVVTLWYRAPEILLGLGEYTTAVDLWAAGAVMLELLYGRPLFAGDVEIDTLFRIFQLLGTPGAHDWPAIAKLPHFAQSWPQWARRPDRYDFLRDELTEDGKDLLDKLLCYDWRHRISAPDALRHPWFDCLRVCGLPSDSRPAS